MNRDIQPTQEIEQCAIYKTLGIFQSKWNVWVLFELSQNQTMRFGELKKAIPSISNTMLTATLRELEELGLVNRVQFNEIPPHVGIFSNRKCSSIKNSISGNGGMGREISSKIM